MNDNDDISSSEMQVQRMEGSPPPMFVSQRNILANPTDEIGKGGKGRGKPNRIL